MVLGIWLGITHSAGVYVDKDINTQLINNSEGNMLTPLIVLFDSESEMLVRNVAKGNFMI